MFKEALESFCPKKVSFLSRMFSTFRRKKSDGTNFQRNKSERASLPSKSKSKKRRRIRFASESLQSSDEEIYADLVQRQRPSGRGTGMQSGKQSNPVDPWSPKTAANHSTPMLTRTQKSRVTTRGFASYPNE